MFSDTHTHTHSLVHFMCGGLYHNINNNIEITYNGTQYERNETKNKINTSDMAV